MSEQKLIPVRYVGARSVKSDNITGSSHTWTPGAVREVEAPIAHRLLRHPSVWRHAEDAWEPGAVVQPAAVAAAAVPLGLPAGAQAAVLGASELLLRHWVEVLLKGSRDEIAEKLQAADALLAEAPWLLDEIGLAEEGGRKRANVLDLLEGLQAQYPMPGNGPEPVQAPVAAADEQPGLDLAEAAEEASA